MRLGFTHIELSLMSPSLAPGSISPSDTIMARATYRGLTVANFISHGFVDLAEVLGAVRAAAGSVVGYLEINLRNATRGWSEDRALFIAPPSPGTQLSLF